MQVSDETAEVKWVMKVLEIELRATGHHFHHVHYWNFAAGTVVCCLLYGSLRSFMAFRI